MNYIEATSKYTQSQQ